MTVSSEREAAALGDGETSGAASWPEWTDAEDRRLRPHPAGRLSAAPGAPARLDDEARPAAVLPGGSFSFRPGHQRPRRPPPNDGPARRLRAGPRAGRPSAGGGEPAAGRLRAGAARQRRDGRPGAALPRALRGIRGRPATG